MDLRQSELISAPVGTQRLEMPPQTAITFKQAQREPPTSAALQAGLGLE